jgi:hypothetical protein
MSPPRNPARFLGGVAIWAAVVGGVASLAAARSQDLRPPAEKVLRFATHSPARVEARIQGIETDGGWSGPGVGDPVLVGEQRTFAGIVSAVRLDESVAATATPAYFVSVLLDPEYDPRDLEGASFEYGETSGDFVWIVETLLPPEKRDIIVEELTAFTRAHADELKALLQPIEEQVVEHAEHVLEANLTDTLKRHEKEIDALLDKYRGSLKDELLPVLKDELGPTAKEKAKPILTKIGRECWDALPMWQGGWALIKKKMPWTSKDYVDEWWQDFLENKAIPILKEHEGELMKAGEDLIKEGFKNPKVRAAFNDQLKKLASDPEARRLGRTILEEALVKPFDPAGLVKKIIADPQNRAHFKKLNESFAPVLQRIARLVTVQVRPDGKEGLSPELARVLRRRMLNKDARWVTVTPKAPLVARSSRSG